MKYSNVVVLLFLILSLIACGGGGSGGAPIINPPNNSNPGLPSNAEQTLSEIEEALDDLGL